jgi:hypothetical protein
MPDYDQNRDKEIANEIMAGIMRRGNPLIDDLKQEWRDKVVSDIEKLFEVTTEARVKIAVIETKILVYAGLVSAVVGIITAYIVKHIGG